MAIRQIERMLAGTFELLRRYQDYNWRNLLGASICVAAVLVALAYVPLKLGADRALPMMPMAMILSGLLFGTVSMLLSALIAGVGQLFLDTVQLNVLHYCVGALLACALLRGRTHPVFALLAYGASNALVQSIVGDGAQLLASLLWWSSIVGEAVVNVSMAAALWTLLPQPQNLIEQRRRPRHQRHSLTLWIFAWAMTVSVLPWVVALNIPVVVERVARGAGNVPARSLALIVSAGVVTALCTWLSRHIAATIKKVNANSLFGGVENAARQRPSWHDAPGELASVALPLRRKLRGLQLAIAQKNRQLVEAKSENDRQRASKQELKKKLQAQTQTLLQVQQRDTTSLKDLETALREARATIEQIRRGRNLFVAMMSHEVRTPLHGLMATLGLLREESLSSEGRRQLDIARSSARALLRIANDILDLSRIETGGFAFELAPFDPRRLINAIIEQFQANAQAQHLKLVGTIADDLPTALHGDRNRIEQVISNLVTNALKFTEKGGVNVRASWRDNKLIVDVVDTGKGVPPQMRDQIFQSFVQAESLPGRRAAGTGLGLTIGRHLAKAMGGSLSLHSTGQYGSVFRLELQLEITDEPVPDETSQRILAHPTGHILVVEDNQANQYVAKVLLESLECTVVIVDRGATALERVQQEDFDMVLMDCELPVMDGYETTQRMRQTLTKKIPIIAMTANALPEDKAKCLDAGMDDFLTKPFSKATLSRMLCQWLAEDATAAEKVEPVLDTETFDELWESLQWRTKPIQDIYDAFANNVRKTSELLAQPSAVPSQQLLRSLHTVKGSAGMVGAKRIGRIAAILEHAAKNQQLKQAAIDEADLNKELREVERAVAGKLAPYTNGRAG